MSDCIWTEKANNTHVFYATTGGDLELSSLKRSCIKFLMNQSREGQNRIEYATFKIFAK
jgi:hypothetical protein